MAMVLSPQVFSITAHLIEDRTGLHYEPSSLEQLAEKLEVRALELGLDSLIAYYYFLRYDARGDEELRALAETLVIHETYFFRELGPLRVLVSTIIPALVQRRLRVRIWSAACATGEEPYTVAMMLCDQGLKDRVEIVASDLSERALTKARTGVYSGRSLRAIESGGPASRYFEETQGGVRVREDLRHAIDWRRVNLMDAEAVRALGAFDLVLCRNVLIYFADATVGRVAEQIGATLEPDGLLLVGASESLLRFGTLFTCEEHGGCFFYRKQST